MVGQTHETLAADALARVVAAIDPAAVLRRTWPLSGGISSRMTVLELVGANGQLRQLVLRQPEGALHGDPKAAANEFHLLAHLNVVGLPTPAPVILDESGELISSPYLVVEYIDGASDLIPANPNDAMAQLATQLLRIHRVDCNAAALEFVPAYVPRFVHQRDSNYPDASLGAQRIRDALATAGPARTNNPNVLLHGDYWPGNVLWKNATIVGVIDWEEACLGDPLTDLSIARLDILWAFGSGAMHEFTRRYRIDSGFDMRNLPYWDLDAALRPVFNIGEWASTGDVTEATMRAGHQWFVDQAFAALRG